MRWVLGLVLCGGLGCRHAPSDVREWRPSDHSHENGEASDFAPATAGDSDAGDDDPMIAAQGIWAVQCATCHGSNGRGDGPQAPLTHPPDLTTAAFQNAHPDGEVRAVLMQGRALMPAFGPTIRPEGIELLVRFVRTLQRGAPMPSPSIGSAVQ